MAIVWLDDPAQRDTAIAAASDADVESYVQNGLVYLKLLSAAWNDAELACEQSVITTKNESTGR